MDLPQQARLHLTHLLELVGSSHRPIPHHHIPYSPTSKLKCLLLFNLGSPMAVNSLPCHRLFRTKSIGKTHCRGCPCHTFRMRCRMLSVELSSTPVTPHYSTS